MPDGSLTTRSSLPTANSLQVELRGSSSFRFIDMTLPPGQTIITEPGAMASCDPEISLVARTNGGILRGLIAKYLGSESFFINYFQNTAARSRKLILTQKTPGEIIERQLNDEEIFVQPGAFIAHTPGIQRAVKWAGFSSFLAREGLFRLSFKGSGKLWYGCYGAIVEREVKGEMIVDSGHLLSYPPSIHLKAQLSGGIFSSFFSGEGIVLRLSGSGKIQLQTRSVSGLASWLNPRFWT